MKRLVIGRAADCDWVVDDEYASPRHAALVQRSDGSVWLEDLGSTNTTQLNGAKVWAPTPVRSGDTIRVGRTNLTVP